MGCAQIRNWVYVPTAAIEKQHAEEAEDEARRNHEQNEEERILTAMRKLPGYSEYREINPSPVAMSIAEQEKEKRQFKRMMEDGDNDGAYWPGREKTTPARKNQIDEMKPCASSIHRATNTCRHSIWPSEKVNQLI